MHCPFDSLRSPTPSARCALGAPALRVILSYASMGTIPPVAHGARARDKGGQPLLTALAQRAANLAHDAQHRVIKFIYHAFFQRDDGVISDFDALRADLS